MCVHKWVQVPKEAESIRSPVAEVTGGCKSCPKGYSELNLGPLQEQ